jgi:glycine reductase
MRQAVPKMAKLALKLAQGEPTDAAVDGYLTRGIRKNYFAKERGSARAVEMLVRKLGGQEFTTEYPMPQFDRVDPNPAVRDMSMGSMCSRPRAIRPLTAGMTQCMPMTTPTACCLWT